MKVLQGLEPASVFGFFEEICSIPHGSGNTRQISDYLVEFARKYARFAYEKGCLPVAPHLYFPQFLKESDVQERMAGIQFGLSLLKECREVWVFGEMMSTNGCGQ